MNVPDAPSVSELSRELAAAMEWWREAGVENDFADDATAWLGAAASDEAAPPSQDQGPTPAKPASTAQPVFEKPQSGTVERIDFFSTGKPQTLQEFEQFWMSAPQLDVIGPRGRIPPRGAAKADLMILVVDPEETDTGKLLSGPQGGLLDRVLAAIGVDHSKAYIASALPRHTPMADTHALAASGMDAVLDHHIALVAPKRLIAFGAGLAPLLAKNVSSADTSLRDTNQDLTRPPVLMSEGLDSLMDMPRLKARFWRRWMEWSALP
jgi:uracil-DNA glycosylase